MIQSTQSHVHDDDTCPICLTVLYKPIRLNTCNHIFCGPCIDEATHMYDHKLCPLCRKKFAHSDKIFMDEKSRQLQKRFPNQTKSRIENVKQQKFYRLQIGNTTEVIQTDQDNKYRWTLFVRPAQAQSELSKYVQKVEVKLHPTFNPSTVTFKGTETIELKRLGWGTFRIDIKVYWKKPYAGFVEVFHDLKFEPIVKKVIVCKVGEPIGPVS